MSDVPGGASLRVRVIPRAGRTALAGHRSGHVLIRLAATPVEGAANKALVVFVARLLAIPPSAIHIAAGEHSRNKRLIIAGVTAADVRDRLNREDARQEGAN